MAISALFHVSFRHKADIAEFGLDHFQSGSLTRYDDFVRRNESREYCWHVRCYWRRLG